jgi:hypothetical protein
MPTFQVPPTYAEIILEDKMTGKPYFNPIWLKWFVDIQAFVTVSGGPFASLYGSASQPFLVGTASLAGHAVRLDQLNALRYASAQVAVPAADTDTTSAHGLGAVPTQVSVSLVCTTAELGYSISDEIPFSGSYNGDGAQPIVVWANATVVGWRSYSTTPVIKRRDAAGVLAITNANWRLIFRAWL